MDANRFDAMARGLTADTSRRRVFGGLLAGTATLLTGATVLGAKGGNGKRKNKPKVSFCHRRKNGTYKLISVGGSEQKGHRKHGDAECVCEGTEPCTFSCDQTTGLCVAEAPAG